MAKRTNRPPHVAVLIETSRNYGRGLLRGLALYLKEHGPWSVYFEPYGFKNQIPAWLKNWKGDGILARIDSRRVGRQLLACRLPLIDLRNRFADLGITPVMGSDNRAIAYMVAGHLLERGYRQFAFYGLPRGAHPHMDERRLYFRKKIEAAGFSCVDYATQPSQTWERQQNALARWVKNLPKPCGVMTCNDDCGLQFLDACLRASICVPDDLAVVSVDNDEHLCALSNPPLSSVDVNAERVGYESAAMLARMMSGKRAPNGPVLIEPLGVVTRASSDALAVEDADVSAALRYIREHVGEGVNVERVLQNVSISRSSLERRFMQITGQTPKEAILRTQLELARRLLKESDLSLCAVADKSGFSSLKYFIEVFRKRTGSTPGKFRQTSRGSPRTTGV